MGKDVASTWLGSLGVLAIIISSATIIVAATGLAGFLLWFILPSFEHSGVLSLLVCL